MTLLTQPSELNNASAIEQVLINGDLKSLTSEQRIVFYNRVCESMGLNPLTKPFEYITLNGKLTLYARRDCTDQLRKINGVSVTEMTETEREGVFIVTVKVSNKEGRTDMAKGAVNISGMKGEMLANALMKAETKAKRRATLSICGLGLLDETEVETIPSAVISNEIIENSEPAKNGYAPKDVLRPDKDKYIIAAEVKADGTLNFDDWSSELHTMILAAKDSNELSMWNRANSKTLKVMQAERPDLFVWFGEEYRKKSQTLI